MDMALGFIPGQMLEITGVLRLKVIKVKLLQLLFLLLMKSFWLGLLLTNNIWRTFSINYFI